MNTVFKCFDFEACHSLPHLPIGHKCREMHGHSYKVKVFVRGLINPVTKFVVDYGDISKAWEPIYQTLDHGNVNKVCDPSTSENLSKWIWDRMLPSLPGLCCIEVWETATAGAKYEGAEEFDAGKAVQS